MKTADTEPAYVLSAAELNDLMSSISHTVRTAQANTRWAYREAYGAIERSDPQDLQAALQKANAYLFTDDPTVSSCLEFVFKDPTRMILNYNDTTLKANMLDPSTGQRVTEAVDLLLQPLVAPLREQYRQLVDQHRLLMERAAINPPDFEALKPVIAEVWKLSGALDGASAKLLSPWVALLRKEMRPSAEQMAASFHVRLQDALLALQVPKS